MEPLLPLAGFAFVTSITPGPNNLMLAASGVEHGLRRTIPHLLGVCVGFGALLLLCGLGVGAVILQLPAAGLVLKIAGSGYLLYLAWALRTPGGPGTDRKGARPLSFRAAATFQLANPKVWVMCVTCASVFLPTIGSGWAALGVLCLVTCSVNLPCVTTWALLGSTIRSRLHDPRWQRRFSTVVVALTLYAAVAIWL